MDLTDVEKQILDRYSDKMHALGGPKAGYVLRRQAIVCQQVAPQDEIARALVGLEEKGLLAANEGQGFFFLTEAGVEALGS